MHEHLVGLGRIIKAHGIRGALLVKLDNPQSDSLRSGIEIQIKLPSGEIQKKTVSEFVSGRFLKLDDVSDRNEAEKLSKSLLFIQRQDFPNIAEDEIYLHDMLGFEVVDVVGNPVGKVEEFSDNQAQVLLGVRNKDGFLGFIPYVAPLVVKVDSMTQTIVVDLPEGLFES